MIPGAGGEHLTAPPGTGGPAAPGPVAALRPLGVGELLDAALKIYRSRPKPMIVAALVLTAPAVVLQTLVGLSAGSPDDLTRTDPDTGLLVPEGGAFAIYLGGLLLSTVILIVANNLALAGTTRMSLGAYLGEDVGWRESIRFAARRFVPLTVLLVVTSIGLIGGFFLCIAPGIWLQGIWAVAIPALLVEETGTFGALGRSQRLVSGRFWPVLGTILLGSLMVAMLQGVLTGPILLLQFVGVDFFLTTMLNGVAQLIGVAVTTPFMAALGAVIYIDLRVRKEGYDLELMAQGVGVDGTGDPDQVPDRAPWIAAPAPAWGPPGQWGPPPGQWGPPPDQSAPPPGGWGAPAGPPPGAWGPPPADPGAPPPGAWGPPPGSGPDPGG